jgi:hypothetical protein
LEASETWAKKRLRLAGRRSSSSWVENLWAAGSGAASAWGHWVD